MSFGTNDVIRNLDADEIARLVAENTTLKSEIEQQRADMSQLHHTIGGLECKLQGRAAQIRILEREIERLKPHSVQFVGRMNRTGTP